MIRWFLGGICLIAFLWWLVIMVSTVIEFSPKEGFLYSIVLALWASFMFLFTDGGLTGKGLVYVYNLRWTILICLLSAGVLYIYLRHLASFTCPHCEHTIDLNIDWECPHCKRVWKNPFWYTIFQPLPMDKVPATTEVL
jgi:hypothetical protein